MSTMFWIWAAAAVVFLILELMTPTLIFACFVVASAGSGIYAWFYPDEYYWQIGIFIAIAAVLLPATRTLARRITKPEPTKSNVDALIGKIALVTREIDKDLGGQVKVEGEIWRALADEDVAVGEKVEVMKITGAKLHVKKLYAEKENEQKEQ